MTCAKHTNLDCKECNPFGYINKAEEILDTVMGNNIKEELGNYPMIEDKKWPCGHIDNEREKEVERCTITKINFCPVCAAPRPKQSKSLEEKFREYLPYAGSDMNLEGLAEIAHAHFFQDRVDELADFLYQDSLNMTRPKTMDLARDVIEFLSKDRK